VNPHERIRTIAEMFSRPHAFVVLESLRDGHWHLASELAHSLKIHTTTVMGYLAGLHTLGILLRKPYQGRGRPTFSYALRSPKIYLEIDLGLADAKSPPAPEAFNHFTVVLIQKAEALGIFRLRERLLRGEGFAPTARLARFCASLFQDQTDSPALTRDEKRRLLETIRDILRQELGDVGVERIFQAALGEVGYYSAGEKPRSPLDGLLPPPFVEAR